MVHTIDPVYDAHSKVLILGSFPSVKSREQQFFYGHKQNRFWRVLAQVLECETPTDIQQKKAMLIGNHIAVWDVIASCEITGSSDASIRDVTPARIFRQSIRTAARRTSYIRSISIRLPDGRRICCLPPVRPMQDTRWSGWWKRGK